MLFRTAFLFSSTVCVLLATNGSPVSAVRLNGDKRAIYGCLNEVGNLSFIKMPAWHLPAC